MIFVWRCGVVDADCMRWHDLRSRGQSQSSPPRTNSDDAAKQQSGDLKQAYLHWLLRNRIDGTCCPYLEFIEHHVSQTLIEHNADVDVCCELLSGYARVHRFVPVVVVSGSEQLLPEIVDGGVFFGEPERGLSMQFMSNVQHDRD